MSVISVAVFDDHPVVLEGLLQMLAASGDFEVCGSGRTAAEALECAQALRPDVVVMDLMMPGDVCGTITRMARNRPGAQAIVFTASTRVDDAVRALDAGARGYLLKGTCGSDIAEAIRAVGRGETFVSPMIAGHVITAVQSAAQRRKEVDAARLNVREEQIVRLLLTGKTNKEIAARLQISEKTVKHYMSLLMQKLHVRNRLEAVLAAQKLHDQLRPAARPGPGYYQ
ncbi:response regulator transcription factor [Ruixingdingia sedimenti]|uniref:Response regulator transcription factor n=1 Tax=Ruixingdingia sedimenti TaxID=3073604 RepID=A0ABU1F6I3_9RHOB|nr:response regulator transcription factor [Xinfangfangia sp. LG-4]MDR5652253.1 response regulator transcription factor [Xinfangfangia sp. LG-4]